MKVSKNIISLLLALIAVRSFASDYGSLKDNELAAKIASQTVLFQESNLESKYKDQISPEELMEIKNNYSSMLGHMCRKNYDELAFKATCIIYREKKSKWSSLASWKDLRDKLEELEAEIANTLSE